MGKLKGSKKFSLQTDGGISVSEAFDPALTSLFALSVSSKPVLEILNI